MLDVCLLGTGGMMPLPGRRLTALMTRYNGSSLLIDCGEGTQVAIKEKGWTFKPIDAICFTHYHADHISGLPGLLLTMGNTDRREPLTMIGPKGLERVVNSLRVICPELPFPIVFHEVTAPEEVIEMKNGVQKVSMKKLFPGYVMIHMIMNDDTWYVVRNTRGVTGFVGPGSKPVPLEEEEMSRFGIHQENIVYDFEIGDTVTVLSGAWEGTVGVVQSMNEQKQSLSINVELFGRETPVELGFSEVKKMD